ncbi:MAG: chemotaxis-specific methylesterase [Methanomassiliicoccales archaeon PtaU1.Bin124]|nr:MAG: chemotaxis-specific methylesterase [Methanomassiliicoccales archaeon PtaU1.Bin124]
MSEPKKVMIVDDSMVMRNMIRDVLTKNGFNVVGQAKCVADAVTMYPQLKPDLVTMDVVMPGETGIEGVKKLKALDPSVSVLMVSGLNQKNLVIQAMENGAKDYIVKPFEADDLLKAALKVAK